MTVQVSGCSMPSLPASFQQLCASCVPAFVEFSFPPAPPADAGAAAKEDKAGGGGSVKLRTNGQLQVGLRLLLVCGSDS